MKTVTNARKRSFQNCQNSCSPSENVVTILQWNILSDILSISSPTENFIRASSECLQWSYRKDRIISIISQTAADIICLQEVDQYADILNALSESGYTGQFHAKKDSPCLKFENNYGPDGLAIFYKSDKLNADHIKMIYLSDETGNESSPMMSIKFLVKGTAISFVVATLHLKSKYGFENRRLHQSKSCLKHLLSINEDAIVLCGDFNAEKNEPCYQLLSNDTCLNLKSVYKTALGDEPPFTTWKIRPDGEVKHTIDYIWFTPTTFDIEAVLDPVKDEEVSANRFPNMIEPSDHIALACKLRFKA